MKKLITISILVAALLAACGPQATPTMSPADVQSTAFAAASTMVAQTEAAIPTATPMPPTPAATNTLPPSPTLQPLPTSSVPTLAPTKASGGTDNCVHVLDMGEAGPTRPVVVQNQTGGSVNLSLNLYTPNEFGQCGALSYQMAKGGSMTVQLPSGNWYAYAWVTVKGANSTASGSFYIQLANEDKQRLIVDKDVITLKP